MKTFAFTKHWRYKQTMLDSKKLGSEILKKMDQLQNRKVFIFGDLGLDEYVWGEVHRISPEAPVPVVEVKKTDQKLGLSANVAANVQALGGQAFLCGLVGQDRNARVFKDLLKTQELTDRYLLEDPQRPTIAKLRVMSGQHHIVRVDYESKQPYDLVTLKNEQERIEEALKTSDVVIIQDYGKGLVTEAACQWLIEKAHKQNKKVLVDPYRTTPLRYYRGCHLMTPNRDEAMELAKQIPKPEIWSQVDRIGKELMEQLHAPQMVITLGAEGMKIFGKETAHIPTFARQVFDVTGAGDTVISAFALGIAAGWSITESAVLANLAAGVVVGKVGAATCSPQELNSFFELF